MRFQKQGQISALVMSSVLAACLIISCGSDENRSDTDSLERLARTFNLLNQHKSALPLSLEGKSPTGVLFHSPIIQGALPYRNVLLAIFDGEEL